MPSCITTDCNYRTYLKSHGNTQPKKGASDNDVYCASWLLSTLSFPFGIHFVFRLWTWLSEYHTLLCCIIRQVAYWWHSAEWANYTPLLENTFKTENGEQRWICSQTPFKTPLMEGNVQELWEIMQISVHWCTFVCYVVLYLLSKAWRV